MLSIVCFKWKTGRWILARTVVVVLIYHRQKPTDLRRLCSLCSLAALLVKTADFRAVPKRKFIIIGRQ
jgi:hypothetical protein